MPSGVGGGVGCTYNLPPSKISPTIFISRPGGAHLHTLHPGLRLWDEVTSCKGHGHGNEAIPIDRSPPETVLLDLCWDTLQHLLAVAMLAAIQILEQNTLLIVLI